MGKCKMPSYTVRYNGLFDFDGLYAAVISWAKNYGYMWHEKTYKHKVPDPAGAEMEWSWVLSKNVTEYIAYSIKMTVHSWSLRDVEVEMDGKKKMLTNARLEIQIEGSFSWDWQKRFAKGGRFGKWLGKAYEKLYAKEIESIWFDQLNYRMMDLQSLIKKFYNMQTKKYVYKGYLGEH